MAPRRRVNRKNMIGNTRMDAALDAMGQLGFEKKLVRETVDELLDVYEGNQGWPFIEEASYKLLIETILGKQQSFVEEKDNTRKDGISETASAATPTTGITEVDSSGLVAQHSVLHARDDLDSASQTSDHHNSPSLGILETDVKDTTLPTKRGGDGRGISVESKNEQKSMDNVQGSNHKTYVNNVEKTVVRGSMIESSKTRDKIMDDVKGNNHKAFVSSVENTIVRSFMINKHDKVMDNDKGSNLKTLMNNVENTTAKNSVIESSKTHDELPNRRRRPYHGWIGSDNNVDLIYFPLPRLPEHLEKLIAQSDASQRGRSKSRWDKKADDM